MQSLKQVFKEYLDIETWRWMDNMCRSLSFMVATANPGIAAPKPLGASTTSPVPASRRQNLFRYKMGNLILNLQIKRFFSGTIELDEHPPSPLEIVSAIVL